MDIVHVLMLMFPDLPPIPTHCDIRHSADILCTLVWLHIKPLANGVGFQTCLAMRGPIICLEKSLSKTPTTQERGYPQAIR